MNLETKITIYKFTPQLFTLTQIHFFFVQCSVSNFRNVVTLNLFLMNFWTSDAL